MALCLNKCIPMEAEIMLDNIQTLENGLLRDQQDGKENSISVALSELGPRVT